MDYFIRNTASLYDKETNETSFRLPIFLAFLCNSEYNVNQKALGLFQAKSPIAINTIVPRLSHYSISNINTKPLMLETSLFKDFLKSLADPDMDTSVQDHDRILIQQGGFFKFHPLVSQTDLQLLVSTKDNTCTRQIRTYFKEIIQIET